MHFSSEKNTTLVVQSLSKTQDLCSKWRNSGETLGLVPTMGCLHEGHVSLIKAARESCDKVVVSIFVNPLQFGKNEDFGTYPRTFERDLEKCRDLGTDLVFHPNRTDFYSRHFATRINSGPLGKLYCGKSRPGFFDGVLTVVTALFNITRPHRAYFGEKDFQQLYLIKQLVRDFRFEIDVVGMPIIRESTGLAMSSRNEYLTNEQRQIALCLFQAIDAVKHAYKAGDQEALSLLRTANSALLRNDSLLADYLHIVDESSLAAITGEIKRPARLLLAGYIGNTPRIRLIDNARIN